MGTLITGCLTGGGGGVLPDNLGRGVRPVSQNPYPIYDMISSLVQINVKIPSTECVKRFC